jgi:uncharacterized Zn-binding protein involved in type VI secretion
MGKPAAKQNDKVTATDTHIVLAPAGSKSPVSLPFQGILNGGLSSDVKIMGMPAATAGSTAQNQPPHVAPPPSTFDKPPSNKGTIKAGSATVKINGKAAARDGDVAETCNDPADLPAGKVVATGTVSIG